MLDVDPVTPPASAQPLPRRLHLELTNRCNSLCTTCVRTTSPDPERDLTLDEVVHITGGLPDLTSVALQVNGEPLLYRGLPHVLRMLKRRGVFVELNSNGIAIRMRRVPWLLESGLDQLNVSVDSTEPATYAQLRGVDALDRVVRNLTQFIARRGPAPALPSVALWMTATQANLGDITKMVELAARIGAEAVFLQRLVYFGAGMAREESSVHARMSSKQADAIATAEVRAAERGVELRTCGRHPTGDMLAGASADQPWRDCRRAWEGATVMANGDLVPCCISTFIAPRADIRMGNVLASGWDEVWNGPAMTRHRELLEHGDGPDYCQSCGVRWSL